jgi:hypothetical protein
MDFTISFFKKLVALILIIKYYQYIFVNGSKQSN